MKKGEPESAKKEDISNKDVLKALMFLTDRMATKDDIEYLKNNTATKSHIEALKDDMDVIGEDLDTVKGEVVYMRTQMAMTATKEDLKMFPIRPEVREMLESVKEDILEEIRPIARAQDADAVTVINHEKRIVHIERQLVIK